MIDIYFKSFLLQGVLDVDFDLLVGFLDLCNLLLMGVVVCLDFLIFALLRLSYFLSQIANVFVQLRTFLFELSDFGLLKLHDLVPASFDTHRYRLSCAFRKLCCSRKESYKR